MQEVTIVHKRLGASSAALYLRVRSLIDRATPGETPTRIALRGVVLEMLCGAYHDYRSEAQLPKGDLVLALRDLPRDELIAHDVARLESDVLAGMFDEDTAEGKRYAERVAGRARPLPSIVQRTTDVQVTAREREVFEFLDKYADVYRRPPTIREIAEGVGISPSRVTGLLRQLADKWLVVNIGGSRGWTTRLKP